MKNLFSSRCLLCQLGLFCLFAVWTVPTKAQSVDQSEVVFEPSTSAEFTHQVRWQGVPGRLYVIQASTDLQTWLTAPVVEMGAGDTIIWGFTPSEKAFFRLKYTIATNHTLGSEGDADGDGLTNGEEVVHYGTDPFSAHSDSDTIPDFDEVRAGLNPLLADSDGDSINDIDEDSDNDAIINRWELANTSLIYALDSDSDGRPDGDDWMEQVDAEISYNVVETPFNSDPSNHAAAYPSAAAQTSFRSQITAALPAYDNNFTPASRHTDPSSSVDGPVIVAERRYQLNDTENQWVQAGYEKKANYLLRTGFAAANAAGSSAAFPAAQTVSVPIFVHETASTWDNNIVHETGEIRTITLSGGQQGLPPEVAALSHAVTNTSPYTNALGEILINQQKAIRTNPIRLCVDTNMNGFLEYLTDGRPEREKRLGQQTASSDWDDGLDIITAANPLRPTTQRKNGLAGLILDINNNNSDALTASPFSEQYDHLSLDLDGPQDRAEFGTIHNEGTATVGHISGSFQVRVTEKLIPYITSGNPRHQYWLALRTTGEHSIRVHRLTAAGSQRILMLPGEVNGFGQSYTQPSILIDGSWFNNLPVQNGYLHLNLIMEGVTTGTCDLELSVYDFANATKAVDTAKIQVNVDQVPRAAINRADGQQLGGRAVDAGTDPTQIPSKHYVGPDFNTLIDVPATASIRAIKGRLKLEIPAGALGQDVWHPWMTHKRGPLRQFTAGDDPVSTASFWIGVTGHAPSNQGTLHTWAQAGLLLSQRPGNDYANQRDGYQPTLYLETSRMVLTPKHVQDTPNESQSAGVLSGWQSQGIDLEFVLFHNLRVNADDITPDPEQPDLGSWIFVCKDIREAASPSYFRIKQQMPPPPDGVDTNLRNDIKDVYAACRYRILQAKMEFHNSTSFLFGNVNHKAVIEDVQYATIRGGNTAAPPINNPTTLWTWVHGSSGTGATFNWTKANEGTTTRITQNSGQRPSFLIQDNSKVRFWNMNKTTDGPKDQYWMWDDRIWAFPKLRR